jgi:hypothetical protein
MSFDCLKDCNGACCRRMPLCGVMTEGEADVMKLRGLEVEYSPEQMLYVVYAKPCIYFIEQFGKCSIWHSRPDFCKEFKVGCDLCLVSRAINYKEVKP